jgi:hypothetical protein
MRTVIAALMMLSGTAMSKNESSAARLFFGSASRMAV